MDERTRRDFLRMSGAAMAAAGTWVTRGAHALSAPSERVRHAVIGVGNQGRRHARTFAEFDDCEVVAICDVDPQRRKQSAAETPGGDKAALIEDYRRVLDDASIDSVSVATPDHWHAPVAVDALRAGKHVYVEKPCAHNVFEAKALVDAAAKTGKCVQHGTQSRSGEGIRSAIEYMRSGALGKIRMAKAINHQLREPVGRAPVEDPPPGVNYDLWLGPAPLVPFTKNRWHYNWHWFWDYGTGDIGNDGIHQMDVARWGLGVTLPHTVVASGGQLMYDDDHETPDTQTVVYQYDDCHLVYEMRLWTNYPLEGHDNGNVFYGDNGTLEIGRRGCEVTLIGEQKKNIGGGSDVVANMRNFLDAVKAGDPGMLNAPILEGYYSAALCHLGNIGTRVGRVLKPDLDNLVCKGDDEASALLKRTYREGYEFHAL